MIIFYQAETPILMILISVDKAFSIKSKVEIHFKSERFQ